MISIAQSDLNTLERITRRETVPARAIQLLFFIREIYTVAGAVINEIDQPGGIKATRLVQAQNTVQQVRDWLSGGWPHGSLTNAEVRQQLVTTFPGKYPNEQAVLSDLQVLNTEFVNFSVELESLVDTARSRGQLYDLDRTTKLETYMMLTSPDTDSLRAFATSFRALIST